MNVLRPGLNVAFLHAPNRIAKLSACKMRRLNILNVTCFNLMRFSQIFDWSTRIYDCSLTFGLTVAFYMCHIKFKLCSLEWEFKTHRSRSAILFGKTMRRLNQISRTYSFKSTKLSIWFGACKMRRLNQQHFFFCCTIIIKNQQKTCRNNWNVDIGR